MRSFIDAANRADARIFTFMHAAAQSEYARAIDEAARNLSRIAPAKSDLKQRLSSVPTSQEKLAMLTPEDIEQYAITPEKLVPDSTGSTLETSTKRELEDVLAALVLLGVTSKVLAVDAKPTFNVDAGAARLADGVRQYARYMVLGADGKTPGAPSPDGLLPLHHVRDAMSIVGGSDATNEDPPTAPAGRPGAATGVSTSEALAAVAGFPITHRWEHGFYRTPKVPDVEHVALNGSTARTVNGILIPDEQLVYYPGDHVNCSCAWVMMVP